MGVALLDSSAVAAFLDADDALHAAADATVRAAGVEHTLAASVVTYAELLTGAKLGHHDETVVRGFFSRALGRRLVLDEAIAERAAELRSASHSLKLPDALILATADLRSDLLLTGDRGWLSVTGLSCEVVYLGDGA